MVIHGCVEAPENIKRPTETRQIPVIGRITAKENERSGALRLGIRDGGRMAFIERSDASIIARKRTRVSVDRISVRGLTRCKSRDTILVGLCVDISVRIVEAASAAAIPAGIDDIASTATKTGILIDIRNTPSLKISL